MRGFSAVSARLIFTSTSRFVVSIEFYLFTIIWNVTLFLCCEWIMTHNRSLRSLWIRYLFGEGGWRTNRRTNKTMRTQSDKQLSWMLIDAVRTYCGFQSLCTISWFALLCLAVSCQPKNPYEYIIACFSHDFLLQLLSYVCSSPFCMCCWFCSLANVVEPFALSIAGFRGLPLALLKLKHHVIIRYDCLI